MCFCLNGVLTCPVLLSVCLSSCLSVSLSVCLTAIEDEYTGPKLEEGKVTLKFMKDLMAWFKDQKKLHRKCAYQVKCCVPQWEHGLNSSSQMHKLALSDSLKKNSL